MSHSRNIPRSVDISLLGLWLVCALASAVFAAAAPVTTVGSVAFLFGFTLSAWYVRFFTVVPAAVELAAAVFAAWALVRGVRSGWTFFASGVVAGFWTAALAAQGLTSLFARPLAVSVALLTVFLAARRPTFVNEPLRQEALLFILVLGLVAAAVPGIIDGWHAGLNLTLQGSQPAAERAAMPAWTLAVVGTALVSGGVYSLWSRR